MSNNLTSFEEATGAIDYTFTNDYMFRAILQSNELVLKGLISSLLHLLFNKIKSVEVKNPIKLGETLDSKDFILDIHVLLNNDILIDLEMQIENHHLFNDKFTLNVLCLKETKLATEEDKLWQIDTWAKLFAAKTWRDIKMIAQNNDILTAATKSLFEYNADDLIRQRCRAREEAERHERTLLKEIADRDQTISEQDQTITKQDQTITEQKQALAEKDAYIQELEAMVKKQNKS